MLWSHTAGGSHNFSVYTALFKEHSRAPLRSAVTMHTAQANALFSGGRTRLLYDGTLCAPQVQAMFTTSFYQ